MNPGIDYGLGRTNLNRATGIRFGVIAINSLSEWIDEDLEGIYTPSCPDCGATLTEDLEDCPECDEPILDGLQWPDDPDGYVLKAEGIEAHSYDGFDLFVTESPYFTYAQFCSPCAPGAGHLNNYCPTGPKTYCLPANYFDGPCPYPYYSVEDGSLVYDPKA